MPSDSTAFQIDFALFEGLERFSQLSPRLHFQLFPDRRYLERGMQYFSAQRVQSLSWDPSRSRMVAQVEGSRRMYQVEMWLLPNQLTHYCNCPAWDEPVGCKHVIATYALAVLIFQGKCLAAYPPTQNYLKRIVEDLIMRNAPDEAKAGATLPAVKPVILPILCEATEDLGSLNFRTRSEEGRELLQSLGFRPKGPQFRYDWDRYSKGVKRSEGEEYIPPRGIAVLPSLAAGCAEKAIPLHFAPRVGETFRLEGAVIEVPFRGRFHWEADGGGIEVIAEDNEDAVMLWAEGEVAVFSDGKLRRAAPNRAVRWLTWFQEQQKIYLDRFAAKSGFAAGLERRHYLASAVLAEWTPADWEAASFDVCDATGIHPVAPEIHPGQFVLSLEEEEGLEGSFIMTPFLEVGQAEFGIEAFFEVFGLDLLESGEYRLWSNRPRSRRLADKVGQLFLLGSAKERSEWAVTASKDPQLPQSWERNGVKRLLTEISQNWIEPAETIALLPVGPPETERLVLVSVPRRTMAHFGLALWPIDEGPEAARMGSRLRLEAADVGVFMAALLPLAEQTGVEIRIDGLLPVRQAVEIDVEVLEGKGIDWFELKAEVRCDQLTLEEDTWEKLITGRLLLRDADGRMIVPYLKDGVEGIKKLRALQAPKALKATKLVEVPRLQVLDWLDLRRHGVKVKLPPKAEALFQSLLGFGELPVVPLPEGIDATLREYQHRGFDWLEFHYEHRFGACLADDMGLGKTLQAITFLAARTPVERRIPGEPRRMPHLIVVPPSLLFNWAAELERFCPRLQVVEYAGGGRNLPAALRAQIVLTTYDTLRMDVEEFGKVFFDVVVFDETQLLKNVKTARAQAARKLQRRFTLCLTGTPMENHLGEYFSIMDLAVPGLLGPVQGFLREAKSGNPESLRLRAQPFVLRRTKERILDELPDKVESDFYLEMTPAQKEIYTRTVAEVRAEVLEAFADKPRQQAGIVALYALLRLRQVCVSPALLGWGGSALSPKFLHILGQLEELRSEGHSALIFSQFTKSLDILEAELIKAGAPFVRLDGSLSSSQRRVAVQTFQESAEPHAFLISLKAGGTGLNLTRASYVFHLDPWWNPAVENQATDRAHRIGQKQTVFVQRVLMRHTVEEKIQKLKAKKQELFDQIVENPAAARSTSTPLSRDDFDYLLGS